jgi:hypothetical protein
VKSFTWHGSPLKKKLYLLPIYIIISSAMKPKLYIETSLISYLTARPSRDLIVAAQQQKEISRVSFEEGYELPIICTPYELMGG